MKGVLAFLTLLSLWAFAHPALMVLWADILDTLMAYPPSAHNHDSLYYTKSLSNHSFMPALYKLKWEALVSQPSVFPVAPHAHNGLYYTKAASDNSYLPSSYVPTWASLTATTHRFITGRVVADTLMNS